MYSNYYCCAYTNVIRRLKSEEEDGPEEDTVKENVITIGEAYRLLSYLEYDKAGREALKQRLGMPIRICQTGNDSYVNAVLKMGLIEADITVS